MESGSVNPLVAGVIFGSLLSSPPVSNSEFDHEVILEVEGSKIKINGESLL